MPFSIDRELETSLAAAVVPDEARLPAPGDARALRAFVDPILDSTFAALPERGHIETSTFDIDVVEGTVSSTLYRKPDARSKAVVLYLHGGGMICGSVASYDRLLRQYVDLTGVSFLAVDYRLAPEHRGRGLVHDAFAALRWLMVQGAGFGFDTARIAIMGDSGGGGIAAATAIMARDAGIQIRKQILVYPMLDDRTVSADPLIKPFARWTYEFNRTAWSAVLGSGRREAEIAPFEAPARLGDFAGLAPAYIDVGVLDIFRDECIAYMRNLLLSGVCCEFHLYPGAPHLFEGVKWDSMLNVNAFNNRTMAIMAL